MNTLKFERSREEHETPTARADRLAVWILLALGLLLMLVSTGKAEQGAATRTERINGTLASGQTLSVDNVSGDIVASPGREFSAVVTVTVSAPTQKQADDLLKSTRVAQSHDGDGWSLETRWPGMHGRGDRGRDSACSRCRVVANYVLTVPPGVAAELKTVNGDVRVKDLDGELTLGSVNGAIDARGVHRSLEAQTVNGSIDAASRALSAEDSVELQSVNGSVTLVLPKDAQFELSAETMNGTIASSFPLPKQPLLPGRAGGGDLPRSHGKKSRQIVVTDEDGDTSTVDLDQLDQELDESMKDVEREIRDAEKEIREREKDVRAINREIRTIRIADPRREYSGSIGKGGGSVRLQTLNGTVLLLAAGTKEADARPLVSGRREFVVTVPDVHVNVPPPVVSSPRVHAVPPVPPAPGAPPARPAAPAPPAPPAPPADFDGEVVRGDVAGDFLSTTSGGSYRIGRVSGRVKILTHSGEIRVGGIGAGGELKTFGGDVVLGPVTGDLRVSTAAGDILVDSISGSALADTAGGDIRIQSVGGNLDANTAGGDVIVPRVGGSVRAKTAGGDVRIGVTSKDIRGGITIRNSGGDVSLSIPADTKAEVELVVTGAEDEENPIRSDFGYLTIDKKPGTQRATAVLNGGGEKIVIRTTSGEIRLRKSP